MSSGRVPLDIFLPLHSICCHIADPYVLPLAPLFKQTHFKHPVVFFLPIKMHLGLAQRPPLSERLRGQVKLRPLQVEAQACADGFDEALLQGLGGMGENKSSDKAEKFCPCVCALLCVCWVLAHWHNNLRPQQMGIYAHMYNSVYTWMCVDVCVR